MVNRREFLGIAAGAGAALALAPPLDAARGGPELVEGPALLRAHQSSAGTLMQRAIPSSGEMLPVIGLHRDGRPADPAGLKAVFKTLVDNGGRVLDMVHGGARAQEASGAIANELGVQNKIFWSTLLHVTVPLPPGHTGPRPKPDPAAVRAAMEEQFATFKVPTIDLVMVSTIVDVPTHLGVLREMKKDGRVRYIGVIHLASPPTSTRPPFGELESIMRSEQIDLVGTDYHVGDRRAEEKILPLALERKIAFMAHFTFDRGRFFNRVCSTPLPDWAAEFDAKTWAQFCVKYALGHPAVVVARTGTTNPAHMLENIGGGIGRLPNEAMRKRMADLVDSLPPAQAGSGFSRGPGC